MDSKAPTTTVTSTEPGRTLSAQQSIDDIDAVTPVPIAGGMQSPYLSEKSAFASTTGFSQPNQPRYFHSRRVKKGEVEKPWMSKKDPREFWVKFLPIAGILIGTVIACIIVWDGLQSVTNYTYCPVMDEDFSNGFDTSIWTKEVEVGGYGNGQFEWTTGGDENAFVQDGMLYLKPTLQDETLIETNNTVDLRALGTCTGTTFTQCVVATNTTNGTIVNPVKSARINTKKAKSIKYGRVEVVAKLPSGDWLWPAIWMLPTDSVYGAWPQSGEIDIVESRGNNYSYPQGGNNIVSSTLHWGPDNYNDGWWQTNYKRKALHTTYAEGFHTFGLEWSPKYLYTYIDSRLLQVGYTSFSKSFWSRGDFPASNASGTQLVDPWRGEGTSAASPFDQDFYLILNVAVGGTNGWFADGVEGKPWVDGDSKAKLEFWNARKQWLPTWEKSGEMVVKSVRMWQQKGFNGC